MNFKEEVEALIPAVIVQLMTFKLFCSLNKSFFCGALPLTCLRIRIYEIGQGALGFHGESDAGLHYIDLNPVRAYEVARNKGNPFWYIYSSVLLHEMVHYWSDLHDVETMDVNGVHNESFRDEARRRGLMCFWDDKRGWNTTWINDDPFEPSSQAALDLRKIVGLYVPI